MFTPKLYLAFRSNPTFQDQLKKANPYLVHMITQGGNYLEADEKDGEIYYKKPLNTFLSIEELENAQKHFLSLLSKLTPDYPFETHPPYLLILDK